MSKKPTITIGIPAFNEEANIGYLIRDLLKQNINGFTLKEIIISSDGSRDKTVEIVSNVKSRKIVIVNNKKRKGRALRQNQIMKKANTDVLVLVDADVHILDNNFLKKIIGPIVKGKADLTSVPVEELPAKNMLEKILDASMKLKKEIYGKINKGQNIYTCHGRARAFSKSYYKDIKFKESIGEDAYSYLYCLNKGYKYKFVKDTRVFYKLPENFDDHKKQSIRYFKSQMIFNKEFGKEFVKEQYKIPSLISMSSLISYFFRDPLILGYIFLVSFLKIQSLYVRNIDNVWSTSISSKRLRTN